MFSFNLYKIIDDGDQADRYLLACRFMEEYDMDPDPVLLNHKRNRSQTAFLQNCYITIYRCFSGENPSKASYAHLTLPQRQLVSVRNQ